MGLELGLGLTFRVRVVQHQFQRTSVLHIQLCIYTFSYVVTKNIDHYHTCLQP